MGNLVPNFDIQQTYINENDLWMGILATAEFEIFSITNKQKGYSPRQVIFGRDMILPTKHTED